MDNTTKQIWAAIISKHKWYAGIKTSTGSFYSSGHATLMKKRFEEGTLSWDVIEKVFEAHGYVLVKQWVKTHSSWD